MDSAEIKEITEELKSQEPIFHRFSPNVSKDEIDAIMTNDFWEVGASGEIYKREEVLSTVVTRYQNPNYSSNDLYEVSDFACKEIANNTYLVSYQLLQGLEKRLTKRSTIWQKENGSWKIVYHQGTMISKKT